MAVTPMRAEGQLPNSKGTLYTVPASTKTMYQSARLTNTSAAAVTVTLYFKSGTSRAITPVGLSIPAYSSVFDDTVSNLMTGDLIEGEASAATTVDYWISGLEVS